MRKCKLPAPSQLPPVEEAKASAMAVRSSGMNPRLQMDLYPTADQGWRKRLLEGFWRSAVMGSGEGCLALYLCYFFHRLLLTWRQEHGLSLRAATALMLYIPKYVLSDPSSSLLVQRQQQYPPGYPHISSDAGSGVQGLNGHTLMSRGLRLWELL